MDRESLKNMIREIIQDMSKSEVPIGISNRHIHLSQEDYDKLFPGQPIKNIRNLKQPGAFAAEQTVTVAGPKGEIDNVRLLGPFRGSSQVEISRTDSFTLGIKAPVSLSGDLTHAADITVKTKDATITIPGCIVAKRHIHMSEKDAELFGVEAGDVVSVEIDTPDRKTTFDDVVIRPDKDFVLEMHIDTDEANAASVSPTTTGRII